MEKGQSHMTNVRCRNCGKTGHHGRDCSEMWWSRGKSKGKGKAQGDEHADGWTWSGEHADAWWKTTDWQTGPGSRWWTTAKTNGVKLRSTAWKDAGARTLLGVESRKREGGRDHERVAPTSLTSGTSESGRHTPTPRPSPTPKPSEGSVPSEWRETSVSSVGSWTRNLSAVRRWFALQTEDERRFFDDQSKEHHSEGANLDQLCRSARSCFQEMLHDECVIAIREEPSLHVEHQREVNRNWKSEGRPAGRGEWRFEDGNMRVDAQRRDQRLERFHDFLEDEERDFEQDGPSDREDSPPLEFQ